MTSRRPTGRRSRALILLAPLAAVTSIVALWLIERSDGDARRDAPALTDPARMEAEATWPPNARPAPDFTLPDQDARAVALSSLKGRTLLLTFLDSHCTHICLTLGPELGLAQRAMRSAAPPLIVAVSVNPEEDTPASVRQMARSWQWLPGEWHWLMGSADDLAPVWEILGVDAHRDPNGVMHTGAVYVIDAAGDLRAGFATPVDHSRVTRMVESLQETADQPAAGPAS